MTRGQLRIYLGAAAGVGTTYAMLDEGERRAGRGTHVAVGWVDTHSRPRTAEKLTQLLGGRPAPDALDTDSILEEHPNVVLVDDLHRSTGPGPDARQHWQEVERLLEAGVNVVATLTVQHIASLADTVDHILERTDEHAPDRGLVPDAFLARAEQIEIVDMTPEAIRRRIAHGNVFGPNDLSPEEADLFNGNAFGRLRALLINWMAARLDTDAEGPGDVREKVVVAVSDAPSASAVLRRAARLAQRSHAHLLGVHVLSGSDEGDRDRRRTLVEGLGGSYHEVQGDKPDAALASFAGAEHATQLVLGSSTQRRSRWRQRSVAERLLASPIDVDLHIVRTEAPAEPTRRFPQSGLSWRRQLLGLLLGIVVITVMTVILVANRGELSVATALALYLLAVVAITAIGGQWPGIASAVAAPLIANWYLISPYHTLRINNAENLLELLVFVSVSLIVSAFVSVSARRAVDANRAWREASTLARLTETGANETLQGVVELLRSTFALDGVTLFRYESGEMRTVASIGPQPPESAADADFSTALDSTTMVAVRGRPLTADDHRVLRAFLAQISKAIEQRRLREIELEAESLAQADQLRTAMLRSVSHDLRSPLASIKASVSSLRQADVEWPDEQRLDFLASIESETDRLTAIVTNLLDLSRLEAGVLRPRLRPVSLDEVIPSAVLSLGDRSNSVELGSLDATPEIVTDPALLERVIANLVDNALKWSPEGSRVAVVAHVRGSVVQVHVVDHGPGIPPDQRAVVVQPFHRLNDTNTAGLGLGLAIVDRVLVAMSSRLELRDTPGGGLTAVVSLPNAQWSHG